MKKIAVICFLLPLKLFALPNGFVYLKNVSPSIIQDVRYAGYHNFVGRPIEGYQAAECVLSKPAAVALKNVQQELLKSNFSLKVFDCYRPQRAVNDFITWSQQVGQNPMQAEFYPSVNKKDFFKLGYVAARSGHTRGSTVDLTIVPVPTLQAGQYHRGQKLVACTAAYHKRFYDSGIDMGTGFDCLDRASHITNHKIGTVAYSGRMLLRKIMLKNGFEPYDQEWWHFTLRNEPYPNRYFNFPIVADQP